MAGNPKKRARRAAGLAPPPPVRGPQVAPRTPALVVPRIAPAEWRAMSDLDRVKAIFGMSLDDVHELMEIPFARADMHEKVLKIRVFEIALKFAMRIDRDRGIEAGREEILAHLREMFKPKEGSDNGG